MANTGERLRVHWRAIFEHIKSAYWSSAKLPATSRRARPSAACHIVLLVLLLGGRGLGVSCVPLETTPSATSDTSTID